MQTQHPAEKAKPFRLVKYFTYISLIVIFVGTVIISALNIHWARTMLSKKSEDYALLLVENLNHQVFLQFIIPVALKYGKVQLRNKEQFEHLDKVVRTTLHSFEVEMVNIYDMDNIISYSFDPDVIGRPDVGGTAYHQAVAGKATSRLTQRGNFWQILFGFPEESRLVTFAPLRAEKPLSRISGPVLGVVEITQDLSDDYQQIVKFQTLVLLTCTGVMGALFLVLFLVVKRGENIINQRAQERLKLEEQLSRAKHLSSLGEMVAVVSHEIRNPLGIIRSSAELMKKKMAVTDPGNQIPTIVVEEATRLDNIITDFLNFARPKLPDFHPCRVEEVLQKNLTFLEPQIREQGQIIRKYFEKGLPEIPADADLLYQAFLNILINAIQASPRDGRIDVRLQAVNGMVQAIFEDEGEGIPEAFRDKLWDPFFTQKEKGTGLGLGIVKNIVEAHNGTVHIENRSIRGARVCIQLPADKEPLHGHDSDRG